MFEKSVSETVSFGERLASSQVFSDLFRDGMALVEETAAYLDGPGRQDSKKLERAAALAYATESMRLTTRLMQLASWLLLHRAVKEGEMSLAQANKEKAKVKLSAGEQADDQNIKLLPERLRVLILRSRTLQTAVRRLDATITPARPVRSRIPAIRSSGSSACCGRHSNRNRRRPRRHSPQDKAPARAGACRVRVQDRGLLLQAEIGEFLLEARKPAAAVEQLLLAAGPGRMRLRVDVEPHRVALLAPGGAGGELRAVGHDDLDGMIVGVGIGFHNGRLAARCWRQNGVAERVAAL
jgi:regulator of CtrA degradation